MEDYKAPLKKNILKLDNIDKKILALLNMNVRFSNKEIGKQLRISREVVHYRIKNFEKYGLIKKFGIRIDHNKLDQVEYRIELSLGFGYSKKSIHKLNRINNIEYIGVYNLGSKLFIWISVKNIYELKNIINKINVIFGDYLQKFSVSIILNDFYCDGRKFTNVKLTSPINRTSFMIESIKKDERNLIKIKPIHHKIIDILNANSRANILDIAYKAKISEKTAKKRIYELISWGIIKSWDIVYDFSVLDYKLSAIMVKLKPCNEKIEREIEEYISKSKELVFCSKSLGIVDYVIDAAYEDYSNVLDFIENFKQKFGKYLLDIYVRPIDKEILVREYNPH